MICYKITISGTLFNNSLEVIVVTCYKVAISGTLFNNALQVVVVACYNVAISDTLFNNAFQLAVGDMLQGNNFWHTIQQFVTTGGW